MFVHKLEYCFIFFPSTYYVGLFQIVNIKVCKRTGKLSEALLPVTVSKREKANKYATDKENSDYIKFMKAVPQSDCTILGQKKGSSLSSGLGSRWTQRFFLSKCNMIWKKEREDRLMSVTTEEHTTG